MAYISMGEAHRRITEFLNYFSDAISTQDGAPLRRLLSFSSNNPKILSVADALSVFQDSSRLIRQSSDILVPLLRSLQCYKRGQLVDAFISYEKFASAFIQEFRNWESAWALQALYAVCYEIRIIAERADRELASNDKSPEKLKAAGSFLMKVFGVLALGTVNLCRSVIRSIETARIFDFEEFPVRDKVTYMYYTGRLEVFNENFPAADEKLSYALTHCHLHHETNIRMILKYLIPVKLSVGILPEDSLLEKYSLLEYRDVVLALRRGDLQLLRCALQEHEDRFLRSGVYLVLEKLELQVYRRLIKKIYFIQKLRDPGRAHQIKLDVIVKALRWLQIEMDVDEVIISFT
ncbi:hypothetical protein KSS87_000204 [Heliosperma pusillum]|nr:hypothetical protein KSS87_000204 [Heliosperma pusillum]